MPRCVEARDTVSAAEGPWVAPLAATPDAFVWARFCSRLRRGTTWMFRVIRNGWRSFWSVFQPVSLFGISASPGSSCVSTPSLALPIGCFTFAALVCVTWCLTRVCFALPWLVERFSRASGPAARVLGSTAHSNSWPAFQLSFY